MLRKSIAMIGMVVSFGLWAQDASGAKIEFENVLHEFGKIEKGSKVETVFKFKNSGSATLEISDVSTSCGCTSAKPEKTSYAPGEAGEIPVSFNSSKFTGPIEKKITVVTNDAANPRFVLTIKADVMVDVSVKPSSVFIQKLKRNEKMNHEIVVTAEQLDKLEISEVKSDQPFMAAKAEKVDDKNYKIVLTFDATQVAKGESRAHAIASFKTNSKTQSEISVPVNVQIENPVSVSPTSVYMFGTKEGTPREVTLKVIGTEGGKLELTSVKFEVKMSVDGSDEKQVDIFSSEVSPESVDAANLRVMLSDKATKGRFQGHIVITTNSKEMPEVKVPIRGNII
ncbi:MAG: DUF1573 domain-containing protein [Acidobacteria bacterium]|nr:DUF1573 domain-containing protein [Acidobacteriota bacterium]MCB9398884.1 DUF1573 domain-containing protein [Acidobacteriota bacterium]